MNLWKNSIDISLLEKIIITCVILLIQKAFSIRTIKDYRFEIIDRVKYVYCIKNAYKFILRKQVGFAAVL